MRTEYQVVVQKHGCPIFQKISKELGDKAQLNQHVCQCEPEAVRCQLSWLLWSTTNWLSHFSMMSQKSTVLYLRTGLTPERALNHKNLHPLYLWNDKKDVRQNHVNKIETFQSEDVIHSKISVSSRPCQTVIQCLYCQESNLINLIVCSINVWTLKRRSGEIADMLESTSIDLCVQETRFRGKTVR